MPMPMGVHAKHVTRTRSVGDSIVAINHAPTAGLKHGGVMGMLRNAVGLSITVTVIPGVPPADTQDTSAQGTHT